MNIRVFHRRLAIILSPFLILTSITGILLLFRKDDLYGKEVKSLLIGLHNWEIAAKYIGATLGIGLILICATGLIIFMKSKKFIYKENKDQIL
ncbi:MAG: hypothetical protein ACPGJV_06285 [Bacteriovoracaceae bacterium]